MTIQEKERITALEQVVLAQRSEMKEVRGELIDIKDDIKDILTVVNEFKGGQKLLKWVIVTTIAIGTLAVAIVNTLKDK